MHSHLREWQAQPLSPTVPRARAGGWVLLLVDVCSVPCSMARPAEIALLLLLPLFLFFKYLLFAQLS